MEHGKGRPRGPPPPGRRAAAPPGSHTVTISRLLAYCKPRMNGNALPFMRHDVRYPRMSDACRIVISMTTATLLELDNRVSKLEEFVWHDLSVRVDAMNWALGQTYANTETTRHEVAGIKVDLAHLEASAHADVVMLRTAIDLRAADLRRDLRSAEASIRHDMRHGFDAVDRRFDAVNERFDAVDRRFDGLEAKVDTLIAEIRGE